MNPKEMVDMFTTAFKEIQRGDYAVFNRSPKRVNIHLEGSHRYICSGIIYDKESCQAFSSIVARFLETEIFTGKCQHYGPDVRLIFNVTEEK